jgi:hypothetical protein
MILANYPSTGRALASYPGTRNAPATGAVQDRGLTILMLNALTPAVALDALHAALYCERSTDDPLN